MPDLAGNKGGTAGHELLEAGTATRSVAPTERPTGAGWVLLAGVSQFRPWFL